MTAGRISNQGGENGKQLNVNYAWAAAVTLLSTILKMEGSGKTVCDKYEDRRQAAAAGGRNSRQPLSALKYKIY